MQIEKLSKKQVRAVYRASLRRDFPREERKPLFVILRSMRRGIYECYGLMQGKEVVSYAFFVRQGNTYLLDYFATLSAHRNQGLGAQFLSLLCEQLCHADCVIGEVEDPAFAETQEDRQLQTRRLQFYLRNGFVDTGLREKAFGVPFVLIEMSLGKERSAQWLDEIYHELYRCVLSEKWYHRGFPEG